MQILLAPHWLVSLLLVVYKHKLGAVAEEKWQTEK
jgi:hypothetical protein